jgi:signal transduction histidine kinase
VSSYGQGELFRQGVDGLLLKPFDRGGELIDAVKQALVDSQQKRDAARTQALRPLFAITESLLSETRQDRLLELISSAVCGYLRCSNSGYYLAERDAELTLQVERGRAFGDSFREILAKVDSTGVPLIVWSGGQRELDFRQELLGLGLGSALFVPVMRPGFRSVLYAVREVQEAEFQESDSEMFQILARQAAAAMENARLYAVQLEYVRKIEDSQKTLLQIEKMATAGRLSASIAHEVNNPLHAVQNCLHLAVRDDLPADKQREYINLARVELERLSATVQRMLAFYRPDPGADQQQ